MHMMNVQKMEHIDCFKKELDKFVLLLKLCVCVTVVGDSLTRNTV